MCENMEERAGEEEIAPMGCVIETIFTPCTMPEIDIKPLLFQNTFKKHNLHNTRYLLQ